MKRILVMVGVILTILSVGVGISAQNNLSEDESERLDKAAEQTEIFGDLRPSEIIKSILDNSFTLKGENLIQGVINLFFSSFKKSIASVSLLLALAILLSFIKNMKLISGRNEEISLLGGRIAFAITLFSTFLAFVGTARESLNGISSFSQVLMPILITLLASCGAQGSVNFITPSVALISTTLIGIIVNIIFPAILALCLVQMLNSILPQSKLSGICSLLKSASSWIIGGLFTLFSAVISLQGIVAKISDGVSIKGIKYALSSSVPIIGGSVSESLSMVLASGFYLKSAAGVTGIIVICSSILVPLVNIIAYIFVLKVFGACTGTFADDFVLKTVSSACECLKLVAIILFGVGVLWFIFLGIIAGAGASIL